MSLLEDREMVDKLLASNAEFRALFEEHKALDAQVAALAGKPALHAADDLELHRLKKLKLVGKDRMALIAASSR